MPLTQFSIADRDTIVTSLALDSAQLEDDSKLYSVLEGIEAQDLRLPGLNRVPKIRGLLAEIRDMQEQLADMRSQPSATFSSAGVKRYTLDRVYTVEYDTAKTAGDYGAVKTALDQKLAELQTYLGLPWGEDVVFPVMYF
jgi:hypothetical protein